MDRDLAVLWFLVRYEWVTYRQLARFLDITEAHMRRTIVYRLNRQGLIAVHETDGFGIVCNIVGIGPRGLAILGLPTKWATLPPTVMLLHTLALTDLGLLFEKAGEEVATEWEIRQGLTSGTSAQVPANIGTLVPGQTHGHNADDLGLREFIVRHGLDAKSGSQIPDMVLVRPPDGQGNPRSVAIEFERTPKSGSKNAPKTYPQIIAAYSRRSRHLFGKVLYVVPTGPIGNRIRGLVEKQAKANFAEGFVIVADFDAPSIPQHPMHSGRNSHARDKPRPVHLQVDDPHFLESLFD